MICNLIFLPSELPQQFSLYKGENFPFFFPNAKYSKYIFRPCNMRGNDHVISLWSGGNIPVCISGKLHGFHNFPEREQPHEL